MALPTGSAQSADTSAEGAPEDEVVVLSPFIVSTNEDRGYTAQSSLGGSRLKSNLKDIAAPTSAFTEQFLQDLAISSTEDLALFMLSTEQDLGEDANGQNRLLSNNRPLRMRGLSGGTLAVNFFKSDFRMDSFSTDRVDQSRGPNSVLFGIGNPGGVINVTTKRAMLGRNSGYLQLRAKSHDGFRQEVDYNQTIVPKRAAIRIAAVNDQADSWRNHEYNDDQRIFGTLKVKIAPRTELNVEAEHGDLKRAPKRTFTAFDNYTPWRDAGRNLSDTPMPALGIVNISGQPYIVYNTETGTLTNYQGETSTGQRTVPSGENVAISDFSVLPKETAIYGPGFYQTLDYTRLSAFFTHSFTRNWNLEVAATRIDTVSYLIDPQDVNGQRLKVDTNRTLPTGGANPNAGRAYFESIPQDNLTSNRDDSLRAVMTYEHDLGRWGRHTLAGVVQYDFSETDQQVRREQIISPNAPVRTTAEAVNNRVWRRTYVDLDGDSKKIVMADPSLAQISGLRETRSGNVYETAWIPFNANTQLNSSDGTTLIAMLQSAFWKDRIRTVIGATQDRRTDYLSMQERKPLPGFNNGILYPVRDTVGTQLEATGYSFSAVYHATPWLSLTYSQAQNSALPNRTGFLNGPGGVGIIRPPLPEGRSRDFGFKLDLMDAKLFLTAVYFETSAVRDFDFSGNMRTTINPIWDALETAGVLTARGLDRAKVQDNANGITYDSETSGVELELTANLTPQWRLFFNYSFQDSKRTNLGAEQQAYLAEYRDLWLENGALVLPGTAVTVAQRVGEIDEAVFVDFVAADGRRPPGQSKHKGNLRTNYEFVDGALKGFSVGGGVRFLGKTITGSTATGTLGGPIVRTLYFGSDQTFVDLNVGYKRQFKVVRAEGELERAVQC